MISKIEIPEVNSPRWMSLEDLDGEIWKDVEGFIGRYQVSNYGRVKTTGIATRKGKSFRHRQPMIKRVTRSKLHGYYMVHLNKECIGYCLLVHRLVAEAFIPNPYKLPYVNHKDETRTNNTASNLEWCTPKYNMVYSNIFKKRNDVVCRKVLQYTMDGRLIKEWNSIKEAAETTNIYATGIGYCCRGRFSKCKNYIWRYKNDE